jgi:hypothetical protein
MVIVNLVGRHAAEMPSFFKMRKPVIAASNASRISRKLSCAKKLSCPAHHQVRNFTGFDLLLRPATFAPSSSGI